MVHPTPTPSTLLDPPHPPDFSCPSPDSRSSSKAWYTRGKPSFQFPARISGEAASKPLPSGHGQTDGTRQQRAAERGPGRGKLHNALTGSKDTNDRNTVYPPHPYLGARCLFHVSCLTFEVIVVGVLTLNRSF